MLKKSTWYPLGYIYQNYGPRKKMVMEKVNLNEIYLFKKKRGDWMVEGFKEKHKIVNLWVKPKEVRI